MAKSKFLTTYKKDDFNWLPQAKRFEIIQQALIDDGYTDVKKVVRLKKYRYGYEGQYEMKKGTYDSRDSQYAPFNLSFFRLFKDGQI